MTNIERTFTTEEVNSLLKEVLDKVREKSGLYGYNKHRFDSIIDEVGVQETGHSILAEEAAEPTTVNEKTASALRLLAEHLQLMGLDDEAEQTNRKADAIANGKPILSKVALEKSANSSQIIKSLVKDFDNDFNSSKKTVEIQRLSKARQIVALDILTDILVEVLILSGGTANRTLVSHIAANMVGISSAEASLIVSSAKAAKRIITDPQDSSNITILK